MVCLVKMAMVNLSVKIYYNIFFNLYGDQIFYTKLFDLLIENNYSNEIKLTSIALSH